MRGEDRFAKTTQDIEALPIATPQNSYQSPAPDTDMTVAEARKAWPGKVLWLNFPSSIHLKSDAEVEATTLDLLDQAGMMDGFIMGVTEDMPPHRWQNSCRAIMNGLERHSHEHQSLYA